MIWTSIPTFFMSATSDPNFPNLLDSCYNLTKSDLKYAASWVSIEIEQALSLYQLLTGNYYSLRGDHGRAIKYFRKALHLDRTFLPAWTLMGHEYIELKHSEAAIEAYRSAVGKGTIALFIQ